MQNLVTVSHTLCTHVKGPKNFFGTLVPRPPSTPQRPWSTPSSLLVSTTATAYCTASPLPICVHFSQLSMRLRASSPASASSTTSLTPCVTTCTGYQSANAFNSSCAHWSVSASAVWRPRTWPTCASQCRRHPAARICVLPLLGPRRSTDSLGPLWASRFRRFVSIDLGQSAT